MSTTSPPSAPSRTAAVRLLRARASWFLGTTLLVVLAAGVVSWVQPRTYEATAQVVVLAEVGPESTSPPPTPAMGTEKNLVTSGVVASTAAARLGMPLAELVATASVTVPPQTQMLAITCVTGDPVTSARYAQGLGEAYVEYKDDQPIMTTPERARVITPAGVPTSPSLPNVPVNLVAGLLVGLVAGLLVALLWDRLDPRVRRPLELERRGLPVLGTVPVPVDGAARPDDAAQAADLGARLRTVLASDGTAPVGVPSAPVVVLTPVDDRDVPLGPVAEALARALAARGERVVLVRTDTGGRSDAPATRPGLLEVLTVADDEAALDRALDRALVRGAGQPAVLPLGRTTGPGIGHRPWTKAAATLADRFDVVLVAADPLGSSADALAVAEGASAVVAVVGARGTTRTDADALRDRCDRLGLALVGCITAAEAPAPAPPTAPVEDEPTTDATTGAPETDAPTDSEIGQPPSSASAYGSDGNGLLPLRPS